MHNYRNYYLQTFESMHHHIRPMVALDLCLDVRAPNIKEIWGKPITSHLEYRIQRCKQVYMQYLRNANMSIISFFELF
jgi:hypothetical protein